MSETKIPAWKLKVYGRAVAGDSKKRFPSKRIKREITECQRGLCLYCDLPIGSVVRRKGNDVALRPNWDHFVPYAYSRANSNQNWVLACHICNNIKGCRMFDTVIEAQEFIKACWLDKGYQHVAAWMDAHVPAEDSRDATTEED